MVKGKKKDDPPRLAARQKLRRNASMVHKDLFCYEHVGDQSNCTHSLNRARACFLRLSPGTAIRWSGPTYTAAVYRVPVADVPEAPRARLRWRATWMQRIISPSRTIGGMLTSKLPHKDGPQARCATPLAKGYLQYFERARQTYIQNTLTPRAALEMNASCSYWISAQETGSYVADESVYADEVKNPDKKARRTKNSLAYILPQNHPHGNDHHARRRKHLAYGEQRKTESSGLRA